MSLFKKTSSKNKSSSDAKTNTYGNLSNNSGIVGNVESTINNSGSNNNLEERALIILFRALDQEKKEKTFRFCT